MAALDIEVVFESLRRQGWEVDRTARGHWRATPPDKGKKIVHFAVSSEPRALQNTISELRRNGFVWANNGTSKARGGFHEHG